MNIDLKARLSKDTEHAQCGMIDCGAELAQIRALPSRAGQRERGEVVEVIEGELGYERPPGVALRILRLSPGFVKRDDEVWEMTDRAASRAREDRRPAHRRGFVKTIDGVWRQAPVCPGLPARIRCWQCRMIQVLEAAELRVTPPPWRVSLEVRPP